MGHISDGSMGHGSIPVTHCLSADTCRRRRHGTKTTTQWTATAFMSVFLLSLCMLVVVTNNYCNKHSRPLLGRPNVSSEGLMFYPWCFFIRRATSELRRPIAMKLCHMITCVLYNASPKIRGGPPPTEIGGQKHAKFGPISDNFRIWSRISPERDKLSKFGKRTVHRRFLPRSTKKVRWTLVH